MLKSFVQLSLSISICLISANSFCQEVIHCGTTEFLQLQEKRYPGSSLKSEELREEALEWISKNAEALRSNYTIPVVVHVVWHNDKENISESLIRSQIDVLNEDFNRRNVDTSKTPDVWKSAAGNIPVRFCLAAIAPDGTYTNGITRTYTNSLSFSVDTPIKHADVGGADGWNSYDYLNIWVCNLDDDNLGGRVLGFATTYPGNPEDGVVIRFDVMGRGESLSPQYDEGRTCTHEVGHWLSLAHTFGGASCGPGDDCDDTPTEFDEVLGCHDFPLFDSCSAVYPGVMFMNYMDYSDDHCMNLFTLCQCDAMIGMLNTSRQSLMNSSAGCIPEFNVDAAMSKIVFPEDTLTTQGFLPKVQLTNHGTENLNFVRINFQVDRQPVTTFEYDEILLPQSSIVVTLPDYFTGEGGHLFYAWTSDPNHTTDEFTGNDTATEEFFVRSAFQKNTTMISVQPESSTDYLLVTVTNPSASTMHIQVINLLGQRVMQGNWPVFNSSSFNLDLSGLPAGIYFLYCKVGYDYVKKKIMVVRQ